MAHRQLHDNAMENYALREEYNALRRQLAELRQALKDIASTMEGIAGTMDAQPRHIIKVALLKQAKQARALARVGGGGGEERR